MGRSSQRLREGLMVMGMGRPGLVKYQMLIKIHSATKACMASGDMELSEISTSG